MRNVFTHTVILMLMNKAGYTADKQSLAGGQGVLLVGRGSLRVGEGCTLAGQGQ